MKEECTHLVKVKNDNLVIETSEEIEKLGVNIDQTLYSLGVICIICKNTSLLEKIKTLSNVDIVSKNIEMDLID